MEPLTLAKRSEPLREFQARARAAARALGAEKPGGFTRADLRERLPGASASQVREWMRGQDGSNHSKSAAALQRIMDGRARGSKPGMLRKLDNNLWALDVAPQEGLGDGPTVIAEVDAAAYSLGGLFYFSDMVSVIGRLGQERLVGKVLADSRRYRQGLPRAGERMLWRLTEVHRTKVPVPVPGRWLMLDLRLTTARSLPQHKLTLVFDQRIARIGAGVKEARLSAGWDVETLASGPAGAALASALTGSSLTLDVGGQRLAVSAWWSALIQRIGRQAALCEAWSRLESSEAPEIARVLDVAFWDCLGRATSTIPAALSRGAVMTARPER